MITEQAKTYLLDARRAAGNIVDFTTSRSYDDYLSDALLRSAVERQFITIGEAFTCLRRIAPLLAATIPDLSSVVAFRNILIHTYNEIDDQVVWGVVEGELGSLLAMLDGLLDDAI